jgi:hypothetical protein
MANMMAVAELCEIRTFFDYQHEIDDAKAQAIADAMRAGHEMPPILVLEDEGNGYAILDGHHRAEAASRHLELSTIKAWVVSVADYVAILDAHFDGAAPGRLVDLDDHILCGDVTYAALNLRTA